MRALAGWAGWGSGLRWPVWLALASLLACAAAAVQVWPAAQAAWLAMPALKEVRRWQSPRAHPPTPAQWQWVHDRLQQAVQRHGGHGDIHEALGYVYVVSAIDPQRPAVLQQALLHLAYGHYAQSVQRRPMVPNAWAGQMFVAHTLGALGLQAPPGSPPDALWRAFDRTMAYGQRDQATRVAIAHVGFARWAELTEARKQALREWLPHLKPDQLRELQRLAQQYRLTWEDGVGPV